MTSVIPVIDWTVWPADLFDPCNWRLCPCHLLTPVIDWPLWPCNWVSSDCRFDYPDKDYLYRDAVVHKPGYVNPDKDRPANLIGTGELKVK